MKYLLNMTEVERRMKEKNIKSISKLFKESGLNPNAFFVKQCRHNNNPVVGIHTVYMISRRLGCVMEDILIVENE